MPTCSSPRPQRNLNSVASETKLSVPRSPRSPLGSKIFLTDGGSGPGGQYLFAGMKLRSRSLSHLEGGPNPEQEPQKPECAPLSSSPASGRGLEEAAPRLSHSVSRTGRSSGSGAAAAATAGRQQEKRGGRFTGGGCKGLGSLQSPPCGYAKAAHPSSFLFSSSYPRRLGNRLLFASARVGQGPRDALPLTCGSPWQPPPPARAAWECARPGSATGPTGGHRALLRNAVEASSKPSPPNSCFPLPLRRWPVCEPPLILQMWCWTNTY